jgi:hypothetical protein
VYDRRVRGDVLYRLNERFAEARGVVEEPLGHEAERNRVFEKARSLHQERPLAVAGFPRTEQAGLLDLWIVRTRQRRADWRHAETTKAATSRRPRVG